MRRKKGLLSGLIIVAQVFVLAIVLTFAHGGAAVKADDPSIHITGTITAKATGQPVEGVAVTAESLGGNTVLFGPATTDSNGHYDLAIAAGTYDFHFMPPAGSGLREWVNEEYTVLNDQTLDVQLDPFHTLSGRVTDTNGNPLVDMTVILSGSIETRGAKTDANGNYAVQVIPGTYTAKLQTGFYDGDGFYPAAVPTNMDATVLQPYNLTSGDVTQNFVLHTNTIAIHVQDPDGNPIAGMQIKGGSDPQNPDDPDVYTPLLSDGTTGTAQQTWDQLYTDNQGNVQITGLQGIYYSFCTGVTVRNKGICHNQTLTGDTAFTLVQPPQPITHTLSGHVVAQNGDAVQEVEVSLLDSNGQKVAGGSTSDQDGSYSITADAGVYNVMYRWPVPGSPSSYTYVPLPNPVDLTTSDQTQELQWHEQAVTINVVDMLGNPEPGVTIDSGQTGDEQDIPIYPDGSTGMAYATWDSGTTDSSGQGYITGLKGMTYTICAELTFGKTCQDASLANGNGTITFHDLPRPDAPTNLRSNQDTNTAPVLQWDGVLNADHYNVYRDGNLIGTTTDTTYTDSALAVDGMYTYTVRSVNAAHSESLDSNSDRITFDRQAPSVTNVSVDPGTIQSGASATLTATVGDQSGIQRVEYFEQGNDPGQGNGSYMNYYAQTQTATVVLSNLSAGQHVFVVRAEDNANNWTTGGTATLTVNASAPQNLSAPSPARSAALTWLPVTSANHYNIYRNGANIGNTTGIQYTDNPQPDGQYQYYVTAVNTAGVESDPSAVVTVLIDTTDPVITYTLSPAPNAQGWNNTLPVTATFTCTDSGSGIAACPDPMTFTSETNDEQPIVTTRDNAGNQGSVAVHVRIDTTAPSISYSTSQPPTASGWYGANTTVSFNCSDPFPGSGIAFCTSPTLLSEGANQTVTGTAIDVAGNTKQVTTGPLHVDTTPPTITYSVSPAPNANGWNNSNVTITFSCSDALSGVASCPSPMTASTEGTSSKLTATATDNAGNTATVHINPIKIDKTAPTISYTLSPAPNAQGWNNTNVTVTFACGDALSGVATCTQPVTVSTEGANQTVTGTVTDNAGNATTVTATVNLDKTVPTVSNEQVTALLFGGQTMSVSANAADTLSGVLNGEFYIDTDPGQGNGTAMTFANGKITGQKVVQGLSLGTHTVYVRSQDKAGNWSTVLSKSFLYL